MTIPNEDVGLDLYEAVRPIADPYDADRGFPMRTWVMAIGWMFQSSYDIVKDPNALLDPNRTPVSWIPWLGQFVGQGLTGPNVGESEEDYRARSIPLLQDPPSARRGTVPAMVEEVQSYLLEPQTVITTERVGGHWKVGTIAILTGSRKPGVSLAQIQARVNWIKAAGTQITVSEITGVDWQTLRDTHVDWADVKAQFANWQQVFENPALT